MWKRGDLYPRLMDYLPESRVGGYGFYCVNKDLQVKCDGFKFRDEDMSQNPLHLVGCASGVAGADEHSGDGPLLLRNSDFLQTAIGQGAPIVWDEMIQAVHPSAVMRVDEAVRESSKQLAARVSNLLQQQKRVCVIGGDHSCAIGTWSGVFDAVHAQGDLGLIWIDAHMDSHTPETSESGRIHGMPLACLLGYGYPTLTSILSYAPKIKPENLVLIGVRSYERGEAALLQRLNVRVYFMDEVKERGFVNVLQEAVERVTQHTIGYGVTLDLDALDPQDAPGVDVPESGGIPAEQLMDGLQHIVADSRLIATEIVEFDPTRDQARKTEKLFVDIVKLIAK